MDLLGGYGSGSGSDDDEGATTSASSAAATAEAKRPAAAAEEESSEEELDSEEEVERAEEERRKKAAAARAAKKRLLPSVDDMLSGGGPDFLAAPAKVIDRAWVSAFHRRKLRRPPAHPTPTSPHTFPGGRGGIIQEAESLNRGAAPAGRRQGRGVGGSFRDGGRSGG